MAHTPDCLQPTALRPIFYALDSLSPGAACSCGPVANVRRCNSQVPLLAFCERLLVRNATWPKLGPTSFRRGRSWAERAPGAQFEYSNVGAALASAVVEAVVKKHNFARDYNQLVRDKIFRPLGSDERGFFSTNILGADGECRRSGPI